MIEITLSYKARPRRTRRRLRSYLSTWVDWRTSGLGESPKSFADRVLKDRTKDVNDGDGTIQWVIRKEPKYGIENVQVNAGTLQKDWAVLKSHQLSTGFCVAVVGHPGWDKNPDAEAYYALTVSFESINRDIEVYEPIRVEIEGEVEVEVEVEKTLYE